MQLVKNSESSTAGTGFSARICPLATWLQLLNREVALEWRQKVILAAALIEHSYASCGAVQTSGCGGT